MKLIFAALIFSLIGINSYASTLGDVIKTGQQSLSAFTASSFASPFEVKGRTGSKRVGGRNSAGKGSRYRGGR